MSRKHAELEREFIDDLVPRTGRSLADWMAAIDAAALTDKNAIIDWLRPQGLTFSHASWLERIHNNGGKPIYLDVAGRPAVVVAPPSAPLPPAPVKPPEMPQPVHRPVQATPVRPPPTRPAVVPAPATAATPAASATAMPLADLLARGKGLRPLADMLIREITQALPGSSVATAGELVSFGQPAEFAVLAIGPRELRLGFALGDTACEGPLVPAKIAGAGAPITRMVVLSDARMVGPTLLGFAKAANSKANP